MLLHRASCCDAVMADIHHIYCFSIRSIRITETLPPFPEDFYGAHRFTPPAPSTAREHAPPTRAVTMMLPKQTSHGHLMHTVADHSHWIELI